MKVQIRMRGPRGIGDTANTLGYEKIDTYEALQDIGSTDNTLGYEKIDTYEALQDIGGTANTIGYEMEKTL